MAGAVNTTGVSANTSTKNGNDDGSSSTDGRQQYPKNTYIRHVGGTEDQNTFDVKFDKDKIYTTLTSKASSVDKWIDDVYISFPTQIENQNLVVGLDIEWVRLRRQTGEPNKVDVLQLSLAHKCLIFKFSDCDDDKDQVPYSLGKFLDDKRIIFVGSGIDQDARKLWVDWGLNIARSEELAGLAEYKLGGEGIYKAGLKDLMLEVLGQDLPKPVGLTLSRWDRLLSYNQIMYACLDAYASFKLGMELRRRKIVHNGFNRYPRKELIRSPQETNQGQGCKTPNQGQGARGCYKKATTTNLR
ncbi:hypothetical protein C5167_029821 [Papaver somniferum]|nr:hypothetical protein C5167_029821 [Papaver somniferum]